MIQCCWAGDSRFGPNLIRELVIGNRTISSDWDRGSDTTSQKGSSRNYHGSAPLEVILFSTCLRGSKTISIRGCMGWTGSWAAIDGERLGTQLQGGAASEKSQ